MAQVEHGLAPPLFDMLVHDRNLVAVMARHGMTRVLCAGNGISQEPRALAAAGFNVVALDLSPTAARLAQVWRLQPRELEHLLGPEPPCSGGSVEYVTGSILDSVLCPGPFDVIVERGTLQLFRPEERSVAVEALARRLGAEGIFLSHCHDRGWRPPAEPVHALEAVFRLSGWTIVRGSLDEKPAGRCAWLTMSTG